VSKQAGKQVRTGVSNILTQCVRHTYYNYQIKSNQFICQHNT